MRRRLLLLASITAPSLAAAAAVLFLAPAAPAPAPAPPPGHAPRLARVAELPAALAADDTRKSLRAVVARRGRAGLRIARLESLSGGVRPAPPARIAIPAAGVQARVDRVGPTRRGVEVPPIGRAGWFTAGPRPGEPGRAVVIGHLDTGKGPGLFARLPELRRGDRITITDGRGQLHRFAVVGLTSARKSRFPRHSVYGPARRPVLVLVTCGGPYSEDRGYRDNVLVYARAV